MKRVVLCTMIAVALIAGTGCRAAIRERKEIEDLYFIEAVAVDRSPSKPDYVRLTIVYQRVEMQGGGGTQSEQKKTIFMSSEGRTVYEAAILFNSFVDKKVFWGHTKYILIGEEAAKDGITKYLDFFIRSFQIRLHTKLVVVRGGTAEEAVASTSTVYSFISERLTSLFENSRNLSFSSPVRLIDFIQHSESGYLSPYLPCIHMVDIMCEPVDAHGAKEMDLGGYAVFKGSRLFTYLTEERARALNILTNRMDSGIIIVKDTSNKDVSLEIISVRSGILPRFDGDRLSVTVNIGFSTNITEQESSEDIYRESSLNLLREQQEKIIKSQVEDIITFAQENNVDIFGIADAVRLKYPVKWEKIKDRWDEIFPSIEIKPEVKSKINMPYAIEQPVKGR